MPFDLFSDGNGYAVVIGCSLAALFLIVLAIPIIIWKQWNPQSPAPEIGPAKPYHAFISYVSSRKDEVFVYHTLLPRLEEEGFRLCVHHRDFTPGEGKSWRLSNSSMWGEWYSYTGTKLSYTDLVKRLLARKPHLFLGIVKDKIQS